jgi:hypothetical protein
MPAGGSGARSVVPEQELLFMQGHFPNSGRDAGNGSGWLLAAPRRRDRAAGLVELKSRPTRSSAYSVQETPGAIAKSDCPFFFAADYEREGLDREWRDDGRGTCKTGGGGKTAWNRNREKEGQQGWQVAKQSCLHNDRGERREDYDVAAATNAGRRFAKRKVAGGACGRAKGARGSGDQADVPQLGERVGGGTTVGRRGDGRVGRNRLRGTGTGRLNNSRSGYGNR